ncbi:MAG TPA: CHAT domain-containing protein [Chloroflexia bacterium]|nr:CHAT domain-containing protein [Chloroflexia bacterium]
MNKITTLFLAANPTISKEITALALDEEIRAITQKIRLSDGRDVLNVISEWAVRPDDLLQYLNQYKPTIVHFSGHGSSFGEIILVDNNRNPKPVAPQALKALFGTLKDKIELVVLNACYSEIQGRAINEMIDFVIGMKAAIGDEAAIVFASSFYRALGFDRTVQEAFDQAKVAIMLEGISEEDIPALLVRQGADPNRRIGGTQQTREQAPLRLVDISIDESDERCILDIKLRNVGNEVVFLKRAGFKILKIGRLEEPRHINFSPAPSSAQYDVELGEEREGTTIPHNISQSIRPNDVDRFTFSIVNTTWEMVWPALYYINLLLVYNEDDQVLESRPMVLAIPSKWKPAGSYSSGGYVKSIVRRNLEILQEFSSLEGIMSTKIDGLVKTLHTYPL